MHNINKLVTEWISANTGINTILIVEKTRVKSAVVRYGIKVAKNGIWEELDKQFLSGLKKEEDVIINVEIIRYYCQL